MDFKKIYDDLSAAKEDLALLYDVVEGFPSRLYFETTEDLRLAMTIVDGIILRLEDN